MIDIPKIVSCIKPLCYYRYVEVNYAPPLDEYDQPCGEGRTDIMLIEYEVSHHTHKGVWLHVDNRLRFVRNEARKRFALPTIEEALISFIARKERQIEIYQSRIKSWKKAKRIAEAKLSGTKLDEFSFLK